MRLLFFVVFLTGCSVWMPTRYGEMVLIINGPYKNEVGRLVKDCPGFENYKVELNKTKERVCVKIWNLEKIYW